MLNVLINDKMLPIDEKEKKEFINHVLTSFGMDVSKPYTTERDVLGDATIYSQEIERGILR